MEEIKEQKIPEELAHSRIPAGLCWLLGVDTPNGIHCCLGGCSSGIVDLSCECDENRIVRNELKELILKDGFQTFSQLCGSGIHRLEMVQGISIDVRPIVNAIKNIPFLVK